MERSAGVSTREYSSTAELSIDSDDGQGNITGKLTTWAAAGGSGIKCNTVIDLPVHGRYDGTTFHFEGKEDGCERSFTLKKVGGTSFEGESDLGTGTKLSLEGAP